MIDQNLQPWLIEVNTNPCLEETSALLKMQLPRMLDDAFKLTLDVLFPAPKDRSLGEESQEPKEPKEPKAVFKIENYPDDENLWQHIYTMKP
jgi:hypothetical protein